MHEQDAWTSTEIQVNRQKVNTIVPNGIHTEATYGATPIIRNDT